jgi:hypothetical protein
MSLLVESLENKFVPFREVGGSNSKVGSYEKPGDCEDLENELILRKSNQVPTPSLLHNLCLKWKRKRKSSHTKVRSMLLS